jgi:hypothetical protein
VSGGRRDPLIRLRIVCRRHPDKVLLQLVITTTRICLVDSPKDAGIAISGGQNGRRLRRRCSEEDPLGSRHRCHIAVDIREDRMDAVLGALWDAMPAPATKVTWQITDDVMARLLQRPELVPVVLAAIIAANP